MSNASNSTAEGQGPELIIGTVGAAALLILPLRGVAAGELLGNGGAACMAESGAPLPTLGDILGDALRFDDKVDVLVPASVEAAPYDEAAKD